MLCSQEHEVGSDEDRKILVALIGVLTVLITCRVPVCHIHHKHVPRPGPPVHRSRVDDDPKEY